MNNERFIEMTEEEWFESWVAPLRKAAQNQDRETLADYVEYPFGMRTPIPPINNKAEMLERFDEMLFPDGESPLKAVLFEEYLVQVQ